MKRCIRCNGLFEALSFECSYCNFNPQSIDGFLAFAPDLSLGNDHYNSKTYQSLIQYEAESFWFKYRNKIIINAIKNYCLPFNSLLEIGCGTGFVLAELCRHFPNQNIYGSDIYLDGLQYAKQRSQSKLWQFDCHQIPFVDEFDVITAFDVIEHLEEDVNVLCEIHRALTPSGYIVVTVPQHPFLWSQTDTFAHHVRRYTAQELISKFKKAGFKILYKTSFISFLMPVLLMSRLCKKRKPSKMLSELHIHPILNYIFNNLCHFEYQFIKHGINFPFGGSLLMVGQKN